MSNLIDEMIDNVRRACDPVERIIFDNDRPFTDRFCRGASVLVLTGVTFSHSAVKIVYVVDCGQHITDTIEYDQLREWLDDIKYGQQ